MIIDSHAHIWTMETSKFPFQPVLGYTPEKPAPVEMLLSEMERAGVEKAVLVQPSVYGWDNSYLLSCLDQYPDRLAGVCLVNPFDSQAPDLLSSLVSENRIRGLRLNPIGNPQDNWIHRPDQHRLWEKASELKVTICVQILPKQLDGLAEMAIRFPGVRIVVDHLAKPSSPSELNTPESREFLKLAEYPNVFMKLAALAYLSSQPFPFKDCSPLIQAAVEAFSPRRLVWGSDFPGILKFCSYQQSREYVLESLKHLSEGELDWIFYQTAEMLWFQ